MLSYTPEAPTKKVPKGYFCSFTIDDLEQYSPLIYWNQSISSNPVKEHMVIHENYVKDVKSGQVSDHYLDNAAIK